MDFNIFAAALTLAAILVLVVVVQLVLIGARMRAMHQEMIDMHETLKNKRP